MKAKYATTCAVCGVRIQPGEEIAPAGGGRSAGWAHTACKPGLFDAPPPAPGTSARPAPAPRAKRPARIDAPIPPGVTAVYTDGSCSKNPGPGGWAWAVADGRQGAGGAPVTTNQRMEIQAALEAVRALDDSPLVVVSDSTYVVNCFRDNWWRGWRARGWVTSAKQPVVSRDLWEPLVDLVEERGDVTFHWVKGHSGDVMNDLVDRLAVEQTALQQRG
jgi:ribonuclease HI